MLEKITSVSPNLFDSRPAAEHFVCSICLDIPTPELAVEHSSCGKIFCTKCSANWLSSHHTCPNCNATNYSTTLRPIKSECKLLYSLIGSLIITCPYKGETSTCNWKGEFGNLESHSNNCTDAKVTCKLGCGKTIIRKNLQAHETLECSFRLEQCKFCGNTYKKPELEAHIIECPSNPNRNVQCKYNNVGCKFKGQSKEYQQHLLECSDGHFALLENRIALLEKQLTETKSKNMQFFFKHCENNHELVPKIPHLMGVVCNVCGKAPVPNSEVDWECRGCDWDCCNGCYNMKEKASPCPRINTHILMYSNRISPHDECHQCHSKIANCKMWCAYCSISKCIDCYNK
jgi:hypothetical protein